MIYRPQTINFREALAGDTLNVPLTIHQAYEIKPNTRIVMTVALATDAETMPVFKLDSQENEITKSGQVITLNKAIPNKKGRFNHTIQFTTDDVTVTLYRGIFEVV